MGAKLNEAATHYSWEGWDHFYLTVASTNCNTVIDMFSELFGPPSHIELKDLNESTKKKAHTEAAKFEEEVLKPEGVPDTSEMKVVYPTSQPMSHTLGVPADYQPTVHITEKPSRVTGNLVNRTYYYCTVCEYNSQNCDSTYTHTRHHLNVVIGCAWPNCGKTYDAPDGLSKHVKSKNGSVFLLGALGKAEAKAIVTELVASSSSK